MSKQDDKRRRAKYTLEFKLEAVRLVKGGQDAAVTARVLGIPKATLGNWIRAAEKGELQGAGDRPVSVSVISQFDGGAPCEIELISGVGSAPEGSRRKCDAPHADQATRIAENERAAYHPAGDELPVVHHAALRSFLLGKR